MHTDLQAAVGSVLAVAAVALISSMLFRPKPRDFQGKLVVISGGSTGIGLGLARCFVRRGARVVIIARSVPKLEAAVQELQAISGGSSSCVEYRAADLTDFSQASQAISHIEHGLGPIDVLICNAGCSYPGRFHEQDIQDFERTMQINYFGTVYLLKAALPSMLKQQRGHVVMVTSVAAAIGFAGLSSYCPTKYAVRGLADTLRNELAGSGIQLQVAYPLDTSTPGYETETLTKPPECHEISRVSGEGNLFTADQAAASIVKGMDGGGYHIKTPDLGSNILISSTMSSLTPRMYPMVVEMLLAPVMPLATAIFRMLIDRIVRRERAKRRAFES